MECRTLHLTILSADGLKKVGLFSKMKVYVVVSLVDTASFPVQKQPQKTQINTTVNQNPRWNFPMKFTVNDAALQSNRLTLNFEIFARRTLLPDTFIGKAHMPASDLVSSVGKADVSHVSYQVRRPSGNPKGVLNFSHKFGEKFTSSVPAPATWPAATGVGPSMAYPYPPPQHAVGYAAPYAYPAQQPAYGYPGQVNRYGYGYGQSQQPLQGRRNNNFGMGLGTGLLGGALAGLVVGDLVSDMSNDGGYDDGGFDGGFDDGGFGGF